jgi:histo-blood group ABO system transferase
MEKMLKSMFFLACLFISTHLCAANVGLCITATGKYIVFVDPLIASAEKHFCKNHHVTYFVFTDSLRESTENIIYLSHSKLGWPYDTMMRYHAYLAYQDVIGTQDYLFALDADMLFVGEVGDEILGERVATLHPGFFQAHRYSFSYEKNPLSKACIYGHEGTAYYAGGFYGATTEEFLKILTTTTTNIDDDLSRGIIAVWHDESHWNRYCINHKPTVVLSPSYCFAENMPHLPFPKKLVALDKNHQEMRKN